MHDVPATVLTRPDLPINEPVAKVGPSGDVMITVASGETLDMAKEYTAMESEALSIDTESTVEPDQTQQDLTVVQRKAEQLRTPQPVTPESPKVLHETSVSAKSLSMPRIADEKKANYPDSSEGSQQPSADAKQVPVSGVAPETVASSGSETSTTKEGGARSASDAKVASSGKESKKKDSQEQNGHPSHRRRSSRNSRRDVDDGSSSDDDSYFATHLPSPKCGRSFSYSSTGSAGTAASPFHPNNSARESDASLSFSDESDDDKHNHPGVRISPMIQPKGFVTDMSMYPQRITRMHSVSSLVSSGSSDDGDRGHHTGGRTSASSVSSQTTSSDPGVRAELHEVGVEGRPRGQMTEASGRRSPIMGQQGIPGYFYSSPSPVMSPPPIMQGYSIPEGVSHPQPQAMAQDQMVAWVNAGVALPPVGFAMGQQGQEYGAIEQRVPGGHSGGFRSTSDSTVPCVPFVYSESEEPVDAQFMHRLAGGVGSAGGKDVLQQGGPSGGHRNSGRSQMPATSSNENVADSRNKPPSNVKVGMVPEDNGNAPTNKPTRPDRNFQVYSRRWLMLFYMSALNLISDWTCYSVAPISLLTEKAFGNIDPERLVVVFLGANAVASISEPIILSRLGLRRTVLLGSLLLMIGSIIKSGGVPPILQSDMTMGHSEWRLYFGFFMVGLSQPLYQCTPTLLSSSWFPEEERTMATGVALNANQLGIGFAFVFGTLLVAVEEDIIPYFGLLSTISTIAFIGVLIQFDDAPPTPPSSSARVVRGTLDVKLPTMGTIVASVRGGFGSSERGSEAASDDVAEAPSPADGSSPVDPLKSKNSKSKKLSRKGSSTRRRATGSRSSTAIKDSGLSAPSPAIPGSTAQVATEIGLIKAEARRREVTPPSFMMPGRPESTDESPDQQGENDQSTLYNDDPTPHGQHGLNQPTMDENMMYAGHPGIPPPGMMPHGMMPSYGAYPPQQYPYPYWDPRVQEQMQQQRAFFQQPQDPRVQEQMQQQQAFFQQQQDPRVQEQMQQQQAFFQQQQQDPRVQEQMQQQQAFFQQQQQQQQYQYYQHNPHAPPPQPYYYPPMGYPSHPYGYDYMQPGFQGAPPVDEGVEPVLTITPHHLDIDIKDDQVIRSLKACFARKGFIHALVAFTASGIVINTLSTYMDYLVRLNGGPRAYTGIVGGTFQFVIMISSLIVGKFTDKSRAYYSVTIGMLVLGAFGLAECGVSLDSNRGNDLRWTLVIVAALVGPLQPVSTELGVDVVYPLSENTVLVIQQLFSNLLSALFIPLFKALKDVGSGQIDDTEMHERPEYTFSFYLLIVIHTAATVFFATFNGKYLRYESELEKKAEEEREDAEDRANEQAVHPFFRDQSAYGESYEGERQPLVSNPVV